MSNVPYLTDKRLDAGQLDPTYILTISGLAWPLFRSLALELRRSLVTTVMALSSAAIFCNHA